MDIRINNIESILIVCLGWLFIIADAASLGIRELIIGLDVTETISQVTGEEAKEVLGLILEGSLHETEA